VAGRYILVDDEVRKPRTVFNLAVKKTFDMFTLRQRYTFLRPLLDVDYGSATFITANTKGNFEVRVQPPGSSSVRQQSLHSKKKPDSTA